MKKVLFVFALCVAIVAANAQTNQAAPVSVKAQTQQVAPKGKLAQIKEADLMKPIKDDYVKQVEGATFEKAVKMENPKTGVIYNVWVKKENAKWRLQYDKDGKFMKKEEIKAPQVKKAPAQQPAK